MAILLLTFVADVPGLCRHCRRRRVSRPRWLCFGCYYRSGVRGLYSVSASKFTNRGVGNFNGGNKLPPCHTKALPGTPEKVTVLEERARLGVALWHPLDAHYGEAADGSDNAA